MDTQTFYVIKDGDFFLSLGGRGAWRLSTFHQDAYFFVHKESAEMSAGSRFADMKNPKVITVTMTFSE